MALYTVKYIGLGICCMLSCPAPPSNTSLVHVLVWTSLRLTKPYIYTSLLSYMHSNDIHICLTVTILLYMCMLLYICIYVIICVYRSLRTCSSTSLGRRLWCDNGRDITRLGKVCTLVCCSTQY